MSMLSSQADELRLMARLVRDYDYKEISRMFGDCEWNYENEPMGFCSWGYVWKEGGDD